MLLLSNVGTLYDGTSDQPESVHHGVDLLLEHGRVLELVPHDPQRVVGPEHTRIDCSHHTITPGLIDCHGHVTIHGLRSQDQQLMNSDVALLYVEKILYTSLVDGGVTTMRDVGGATHRVKRLVDEGVVLGPRLKIAICMLSTTGGHADARGPDRCHASLSPLWPEAPGRPSSLVDGPWECRKRVREIAACGADLIKLCTSPGVASPGDRLEHREFTPEEIRAICDEAGARGLKVAAHAHSSSGIEMAIDHGVHDIQHISWLGEEQVERAHAAGCVVTPTSWVIDELLSADGLSQFVREKARQVATVHRKAVQYAASGGLPILMGTDPVLPGMHGRNYMEVVHLVRDGLSPLAAWWGASGLAAAEIGQHDAGRLEPGRRADLLVWSQDVVSEPERLCQSPLLEVLKDGVGHRQGLEGVPQRGYATRLRETLWPDLAHPERPAPEQE